MVRETRKTFVKPLTKVPGTLPIKSTQGAEGSSGYVPKYGCVVMEVQDWIDAINHPEWRREKEQIFGPSSGAYTLEAQYVFSTTE